MKVYHAKITNPQIIESFSIINTIRSYRNTYIPLFIQIQQFSLFTDIFKTNSFFQLLHYTNFRFQFLNLVPIISLTGFLLNVQHIIAISTEMQKRRYFHLQQDGPFYNSTFTVRHFAAYSKDHFYCLVFIQSLRHFVLFFVYFTLPRFFFILFAVKFHFCMLFLRIFSKCTNLFPVAVISVESFSFGIKAKHI